MAAEIGGKVKDIVAFDDAEDYGFGSLGPPQSQLSQQHILWLQRTARQMSEEYVEAFQATSGTSGRVQETGHTIEAGWKSFLTNWLPPHYEVKTRKYIVGEVDTGENREETDIVILRPNYPKSLREETQILAGGVAAAFSVKATLRAGSIAEAAASCARLDRSLSPREGTPRKELTRSFPYGLLAHSHGWKGEGSNPYLNVSRNLFEADQRHATRPRESLDLVCVPDLGTWNQIKSVQLPMSLRPEMLEGVPPEERQQIIEAMSEIKIRSAFVLNAAESQGEILASFLTALYSRLAINDEQLRSLADSFSLMGADTGGRDKVRIWDGPSVLSQGVLGAPVSQWDHFGFGAEFATTYGWHVPW